MLKWTGIIISILFALGVVNYFRYSYVPRRRLKKFLQNLGVNFVRIGHLSGTYGWPGYLIEFESEALSSEFRKSEKFDAVIEEVARIHKGLNSGKWKFDASIAVEVSPGSLR